MAEVCQQRPSTPSWATASGKGPPSLSGRLRPALCVGATEAASPKRGRWRLAGSQATGLGIPAPTPWAMQWSQGSDTIEPRGDLLVTPDHPLPRPVRGGPLRSPASLPLATRSPRAGRWSHLPRPRRPRSGLPEAQQFGGPAPFRASEPPLHSPGQERLPSPPAEDRHTALSGQSLASERVPVSAR